MDIEEIEAEVSRRANADLIPHLFDAMKHRHTTDKKAFVDCDCNYCQLKAFATFYIGNVSYPPDYDGYRPTRLALPYQFEPSDSYEDLKWSRRQELRKWFRSKLKQLEKQ